MEVLLASITAFISTNIDDLFILTLFFGTKQIKQYQIIAGQFLGITTLIALSLLGSLLGLIIDVAYIGLLGLVPIYLGLKGIRSLINHDELNQTDEHVKTKENGVLAVAGVTVANGGDNIGIYIPLFSTLSLINKIVMVAVFLAMTYLWCLMAKYFTKHPLVAVAVDKYGHIVTPFVLISLGIYILYESNTIGLFIR